jgi:hypothetical protein
MTVLNELSPQTTAIGAGAPTIHTAVLDKAHLGDIHGAFGSIAEDDFAPRTTLGARLKTLLAILGPARESWRLETSGRYPGQRTSPMTNGACHLWISCRRRACRLPLGSG